MKIALVNMIYSSDNTFELHKTPLGLLTLSTIFKQLGFDVQIIDLNAIHSDTAALESNFYESAVATISEFQPDCIGMTSMSNNFVNTIILAEELKIAFPECMIFMGGPQASFVATETLERFPFIDFICRGESEKILPQLADFFYNKIPLDNIPNITYRKGNKVIENPMLNSCVSGDEMIEIDYSDYLKKYKHLFANTSNSFSIEGGRGCPYSCVYCSTNIYWNKKFRFKSIDRIIDEMINLNRLYNLDRFNMTHDLFTFNNETLKRFCHRVKELGFKWTCSSRIDVLDDETIELMSESGCDLIFFGIETGDQKMQKLINKNLNLLQVDKIITKCKTENIGINLSFIMGFPTETIDNINTTLSMVLKYKVYGIKRILLNILTPEHGSSLMNEYTELFFEDGLCINHHDKLTVDADKELRLIKENINLFNHFYYYETENFNAYFLQSLKAAFTTIMHYFKHTLYLLTKDGTESIIEILSNVMNWNSSGHLGEKELSEAIDKKNVLTNFISYIADRNLTDFNLSLFEYEKDLVTQIYIAESQNDLHIGDNVIELQNRVHIGKYKHNIAKFLYCIKKNLTAYVCEEDFYIAMKPNINNELNPMSLVLLNEELGELLLNDKQLKISEIETLLEKNSDTFKKDLQTLIKNNFIDGNIEELQSLLIG